MEFIHNCSPLERSKMETIREPEYVWYASYGSNMCIERFLCYIRGGAVDGMQGTCLGCADKTLPLKSKRVMLPHELYGFS